MRRYVGALVTVVVGAVAAIVIISSLGTFSRPQVSAQAQDIGTQSTAAGTLKHVSLTLQTFPMNPYEDPAWIAAHVTGQTDHGVPYPAPGDNQDWVTYWPTTNLVVPAHAVVTITIENYDSATPLLNPFYGVPQGVEGGSITVNGKTVTSVDPANVSHTFTIHSIPYANNQPWLYVSVPVTGADPNAKADDAGMPYQPEVTQFSFVTGDPGSYIWQCFDPCGSNYNGFGGPMSTKGYMSGTLIVQ